MPFRECGGPLAGTRALEHLAQCTALTRLVLSNSEHDTSEELGLEAESSLLRTLSSLTNLRALELEGGARPPSDAALRQARAASLESCLSSLTALTRLEIRLRCLQHALHPAPEGRGWEEEDLEGHISTLRSQGRAAEAAQLLSAVAAESRALGAALRCMTQLTALSTPARLNTSDLAALTALTYLRVGALVLPPPPPADSLDSLVAPTVYGLPPRLKELKVYSSVSVHVAASLRRSPAAMSAGAGCIFWEAPGLLGYDDQPYWTLAFQDGDIDGAGRLTAEAAATMSKAVTSVKAAFWLPPASLSGCGKSGLRLHVFGEHRQYLKPPPATADEASGDGGDGTHCDSWLGAMAAKLRPMELKLWGFTLSACDMLGMERCLTGVKELDLRGCHYNAASLPLLGGLAALEKLSLCSYGWAWPALDLAYRKGVLEAAFRG